MGTPAIVFDVSEGSLRVNLSPDCAISLEFPKVGSPSTSIWRGTTELCPDDLSRAQFLALVREALAP
jgi:hypothetical protein